MASVTLEPLQDGVGLVPVIVLIATDVARGGVSISATAPVQIDVIEN